MSFLGVLLLLVCTPLGFIRLFGVVGQVLVKPHLMRDVNEEYHASYLEEASVIRKLENLQHTEMLSSSSSSPSSATSPLQPSDFSIGAPIIHSSSSLKKNCDMKTIPKAFGLFADSILRHRRSQTTTENLIRNRKNHTNKLTQQQNGTNNKFYNNIECDELYERLHELKSERKELDKLRSSTAIQRNLIYPLAMLMLLFLTGITVLIVVQNTLELLIGIKALPLSTRVSQR